MKWFDPDRGLGAIAQDGGGFDAAAYRSAVRGDAECELIAGRRVCFDVTLDAAGVRADNIRRLGSGCCPPAEGADGEAAAHEQAGWPVETAPGVNGVDICPWCAQLLEADAGDGQPLVRENGSPQPAAVSRGGGLVTALWAGMVVLAVVAIATVALSVVVAT
ncbi:cold shock domain-containing protein [Streptomyces sp. DSM 40750]|uniref:cold shock domain-containing protein n=1 Tax=Streptomyces sp. DSM 40750 TaxID=2801030 RepID=UPI00214ACB81|nr:cold shock domain-containing protein [Streptomyces sp. DSM 40750]UUU23740.1 cold shock domain-containing protein [Streptomyces sp. DSM 40750]